MYEPPSAGRVWFWRVWGFVRPFVWLVGFLAPVALLVLAFAGGGRMVAAWTGWSRGAGVVAAFGAACVVTAVWVRFVWPRLFRSSRGWTGPKSPIMMLAVATWGVGLLAQSVRKSFRK